MNPQSETERVAHALIEKTLPKVEWTHQAHLRAGLWHVLHHNHSDAMQLMRQRIRAYNEATGVANTESSGYHETITQFYLRTIRFFIQDCPDDLPPDALADLVIAQLGQRDYPLQYYTRELLFSVEARAGWVEPDLKPLPASID